MIESLVSYGPIYVSRRTNLCQHVELIGAAKRIPFRSRSRNLIDINEITVPQETVETLVGSTVRDTALVVRITVALFECDIGVVSDDFTLPSIADDQVPVAIWQIHFKRS